MVIIGKRAGQLGNRLFVFAHIIANAIEYSYAVQNPSFYGYSRYFTGTRNDFFCRYPAKKTRMHIIMTDNIPENAKVTTKPCVAAIQPPISGAMIVAGAVSVCARPI